MFFFMNFGYIEHYGASVADNLEANSRKCNGF